MPRILSAFIAAVLALPVFAHAAEGARPDDAAWAAPASSARPRKIQLKEPAAAAENPADQSLEHTRWFLSQTPAKAVVVLIHGLNSKPSSMNALASYLQGRHADVLRVSLSGHDADMDAFKQVSRAVWLEDVSAAFRAAQERAHARGVPIYFVAHSLGALVGIDWMNSGMDPDIPVAKMVLFAPALAVRPAARSAQLLKWLPDAVIPSMNLPEYRAHNGTPVAAYSALFDSLKHVEAGRLQNSNVPTLVLVDPDDELVDPLGLEDFIDQHQLDSWTLYHVSTEGSTLPRSYHHLIIDGPTLGPDEWTRVMALMDDQLGLAP